MQGRVDEGIGFLRSDRTQWESGNLFTVHNWWHLALYELEAGRPERALAIYDAEIHHEGSLGVPIEMLDASALLWRMLLDGIDTGGRFGPLADAWAPKAARRAVVRVQRPARDDGVGRRRSPRPRRTSVVTRSTAGSTPPSGTNARMTAEIGLPACRAVVAFGEQRDGDVIAELLPIRRVLQHFGGSHAQRDALQRTLLESALRCGTLRAGQGADRRAARRARDAASTAGPSAPVPCAAWATPAGAEHAHGQAGRYRAQFAV